MSDEINEQTQAAKVAPQQGPPNPTVSPGMQNQASPPLPYATPPAGPKDPFYKSTVFLVILSIFVPLIGIILVWVFKRPKGVAARILLNIMSLIIIVMGVSVQLSLTKALSPYDQTGETRTHISEYSNTGNNEDYSSSSQNNKSDQDSSKEFQFALQKAKTYSTTMHMSKARIYQQLTSEYGEQCSDEAAQYALDNVGADWKANALATAQSYQKTLNKSPEEIRSLLTSDYAEGFSEEEADYAIENL